MIHSHVLRFEIKEDIIPFIATLQRYHDWLARNPQLNIGYQVTIDLDTGRDENLEARMRLRP